MGATQAARELQKFSGSVNTGTKSLKDMNLIGNITAGMLVHDLARGFIRAAKEGVVMAGQFQTARTGFERLTARFDEGVISLESLREVTKNTVSDLDLLQTANKAVTLGLPVERMNELFDIASKLGPLMGRTVTEAVNDLSLGIGRQSRMILDNLGIVISAEEAYEEYATTIGKTAEELSKAERDQAFLNAAIAEGKKVVDEVGDAMSEQQEALLQAQAAWDNIKIAIGAAAGEMLVYGVRVWDVLQKNTAAAREHRMALEALARPIEFRLSNIKDLRATFEELSKKTRITTDDIEEAEDAITSFSDVLGDDFVDAAKEGLEALDEMGEEFEELRERAEDLLQTMLEERFLKPLVDTLEASKRRSSELNLELMKLTRSLDIGAISQETYDTEAKRIRATLADLRIRQEELRLAIDDTTAGILLQGEAFEGLSPTPEYAWEGADLDPLTFDFPSQTPLLTGVTGGGGQFQVMAMGGQQGPTRTISITVNLTGEQIAGKTRAEIKELARQLAEEMAEEMRIRGVG